MAASPDKRLRLTGAERPGSARVPSAGRGQRTMKFGIAGILHLIADANQRTVEYHAAGPPPAADAPVSLDGNHLTPRTVRSR
jgi:hypothetical protein